MPYRNHDAAPGALAILVTILTLSVAGCSTSTLQVIRPDYQQKLDSRTTLGIMPLPGDYLDGGLRDDGTPAQTLTPLNRRAFDLYYRTFGLAISDYAYVTIFEAGERYEPPAGLRFETVNLSFADKDSMAVQLPAEGTVAIEGRSPAFVLFVDDMRFVFGEEEKRAGIEPVKVTTPLITGRCEYVIWDNRRHEVAAYGKLAETARIQAGVDLRVPVQNALRKMAERIIDGSPFALKSGVTAP